MDKKIMYAVHKETRDTANREKDSHERKMLRFKDIHRSIDDLGAELFNLIQKNQMYCDIWADYFVISIPYDWELINKLRNVIESRGWSLDREYTAGDKTTDTFMYYKEGFETPIRLVANATVEGSKCVLVPIEMETVTRVKTYDRVCRDGHPELFDDDGNYIGDAVFPKL